MTEISLKNKQNQIQPLALQEYHIAIAKQQHNNTRRVNMVNAAPWSEACVLTLSTWASRPSWLLWRVVSRTSSLACEAKFSKSELCEL